MSTPADFRLVLFGGPALVTDDGTPLTGRPIQRHRMALLALLARASEAGIARDLLMAYLWPESDDERARNLLNVSVYVLRQALGDAAIVSRGSALRLATDIVDVDVVDFDAALARGDHAEAVSLYRGPFMDGFFLKDGQELSQWIGRERSLLADRYAKVLEALARESEAKNDLAEATERWKALAAHDPFDSRIALTLMTALARGGSRAGALRHAELHERLLRDEMGIAPPPELASFAAALRTETGSHKGPVGGARTTHGTDSTSSPRRPDGQAEPSGAPLLADTDDSPGRDQPVAQPAPVARRSWVLLSALPLMTAATILATELIRGRDTAGAPSSAAAAGRPTASLPAYELYRRASQTELLRSDSAARAALALLQHAVELDPAFAAAHAGLARMYLRIGPEEAPGMSLAARLAEARRHASLATELDEGLAEAHSALGITEMGLYRFESAEAHLKRALELEPGPGRTREYLVRLYTWEGRFEEALREAERGLAADPLSPTARAELARALLLNDRCDEALAQLATIAALTPPLLRAGPIAAQCHALQGRWDAAVSDIASVARDSGARGRSTTAYFLARAGRQDEATALLDSLLEEAGRTDGIAFRVAVAYAGLGRLDEAFSWLDRSVDDRSLDAEVMEPMFADLHADPRFRSILERVGLRSR